MKYDIRIRKDGETIYKQAEEGTNLLQFLRDNILHTNSPCGGKGTCGKCRIKVNGLNTEPSEKEKRLLGGAALAGYRLACYNSINSNLEIFTDEKEASAKISIEGNAFTSPLDPIIKKKAFNLDAPTLHDQNPDLKRIMEIDPELKAGLSLEVIRDLPRILREKNHTITIICSDRELIGVEAGDTSASCCGIAVDIGTTTIAAYLYNLESGKRLDVYSALNPQKKFGADVISRIEYAQSSRAAEADMNNVITACINGIIRVFADRNGIRSQDIYEIVFVGNTTMMHFLMKLPAGNLAVSPFIPVTTEGFRLNTCELGIDMNRSGKAVLFPGVSAYVGADTVAAVLSSGMHKESGISLLVDIGTNGEIVLGNSEWMYACSAAAGPAFEGANIRNGVGGIRGAIDKVVINSDVSCTTIEGAPAIGICGSGVVDAIAGMLSSGIIDETGRIQDPDEIQELSKALVEKLVEIDGKNAFLLVSEADCAADDNIAITQKDVRELQNAKAAIAAGVRTLIREAGISVEEIEKVYLAGGFGSYIDKENALRIGLLPAELRGRIYSIGNAAGAGAVEGLLSGPQLQKAEAISRLIKYVELSACPDFMDEYVECMMFE